MRGVPPGGSVPSWRIDGCLDRAGIAVIRLGGWTGWVDSGKSARFPEKESGRTTSLSTNNQADENLDDRSRLQRHPGMDPRPHFSRLFFHLSPAPPFSKIFLSRRFGYPGLRWQDSHGFPFPKETPLKNRPRNIPSFSGGVGRIRWGSRRVFVVWLMETCPA